MIWDVHNRSLIPDPDPDFPPIPDTGSESRIQVSKKHRTRIPVPDRQHWLKDYYLFVRSKSWCATNIHTGRPAASHQSPKRTGVPVLLLLLPGLHGAGETTTAGHNQPHQVPSLQPPAEAPLPPHCGWDFRCIRDSALSLIFLWPLYVHSQECCGSEIINSKSGSDLFRSFWILIRFDPSLKLDHL